MTTSTCRDIGTLVLRLQDAFLDSPGLKLTVRQAGHFFGLGVGTCDAILRALAEANVLAISHEGVYTRHSPRRAGSSTGQAA